MELNNDGPNTKHQTPNTKHQTPNVIILEGDNIARLRELADNSVDSVVTDCPYGLGREPDPVEVLKDWLDHGYHEITGSGFMGKAWDAFVPQPATWKEVYRVLKPGGHLLAFFGSRTYDWGTLAIRLAGFEIRDQIMWIYGSGFPKSLDVAKAMDKMRHAGREEVFKVTTWLAERKKELNLSNTKIDAAAGTNGMAGHWTSQRSQSQIPTLEQWEKLEPLFGPAPEWMVPLIKPAFEHGDTYLNAEIIGEHEGVPGGFGDHRFRVVDNSIRELSESAQQWEGWGTALKPAHEPICVARKPLIGTVAENVIEHGTGALNIDASRIPFQNDQDMDGATWGRGTNIMGDKFVGGDKPSGQENIEADPLGRWPANLVHDGSQEVVDCFPNTTSGKMSQHIQGGEFNVYGKQYPRQVDTIGDSGSAARFFYCAKASKEDRDEGLDGFKLRTSSELTGGRADGSAGLRSPRAGAGRTTGARNIHPTVKPTALMRWLVRLVTPPGGVVLDLFAGSGSTGKAAVLEGFDSILIELNRDENGEDAGYLDIIRARTEWAKAEYIRIKRSETEQYKLLL